MKIYTRGGDAGETALFGGVRVSKDDPRVRAYGATDELSSVLGLALALDAEGVLDREELEAVQADLFTIGARLAAARPGREADRGSIPGLDDERIRDLERSIDALDEKLEPLDAFVLPGGSPVGAQLHVARTTCRRAERAIVALLEEHPDLTLVILPYMNRLSDFLFTLARSANLRAGRPETAWTPMRRREARRDDGDGP